MHRQTYLCVTIRTNMKAQSEATIQFSGYPLSIVDTKLKVKKAELIVVKPSESFQTSFPKNAVTNDPQNWDVDWFNSYE